LGKPATLRLSPSSPRRTGCWRTSSGVGPRPSTHSRIAKLHPPFASCQLKRRPTPRGAGDPPPLPGPVGDCAKQAQTGMRHISTITGNSRLFLDDPARTFVPMSNGILSPPRDGRHHMARTSGGSA
jgi:hypothetical protein